MSAVLGNPLAEMTVLGTVIAAPETWDEAASVLVAEDFAVVAHMLIWTACERVRAAGHQLDVASVATALAESGDLDKVGGTNALSGLRSYASVGELGFHLRVIAEQALRRRLDWTGAEITRLANNHQIGAADALGKAEQLLTSVSTRAVVPDEVLNISDFVNQAMPEYDWVVPGLLEARERLVVVASEGSGKTTLLRQMALLVSQGFHPFRLTPIEPMRTLIVDLENPISVARRKLAWLHETAVRVLGDRFQPDNCQVWANQPGLDIVGSHADLMRLISVVRDAEPRLVCIGPLYKLYGGKPLDEEPAKAAAAALDGLCARFNLALVIETHAPYGARGMDLRPYGASLWSRWPDFGVGLSLVEGQGRTLQIINFRGARDERDWPERLRAGATWPWEAVYDANEPAPASDANEF